MDDVGNDHQIVVKEFGRTRTIRFNTPNGGRRDEYCVRPTLSQPTLYRRLIAKVEAEPVHRQDLRLGVGQTADKSASDHSPVTRDPDALALKLKHCCIRNCEACGSP